MKKNHNLEDNMSASIEDWNSKLDKPCDFIRTDFGSPVCSIQFFCFINYPNKFTCPNGRTIK